MIWTGGDPDAGDMLTYDVYFGTSSTPPFRATIGPYPATQSSITYDPGTLVDGTTYYWKIVARDNHGIVREGPVWDFTTEWDPWVYDENQDGIIQKMEAIHAVMDYFDGEIDKMKAIEVVMLYFE